MTIPVGRATLSTMKPETVDSLAARVRDGALLALPPDYSYVPMALIMALIRRRVRNLHLLAVPIGGLAADILIGAGCVKTVEAAAVSLGEAGPAGRAPVFWRENRS